MIRCAKCDNTTRTSTLVTANGEVALAGTLGTDPQPILAQVCSACGYIELYAPQPLQHPELEAQDTEALATEQAAEMPIPAG